MKGKIGRFTIVGKLGEGGMGEILIGHDEALGRRAAIKVLLDHDDPTGRQRLFLEARAAASVNHPNICQVYEVGEDDGTAFIAMELLEGQGLDTRLARGPIVLPEAIEITLQVLRGLEEIHRRGFVHRDLKPSNIHITPHGAKILDLGLVRPLSDAEETAALDLTRPGTLVGTPHYMAPEQWTGSPVGPSTDIFAVGAILYEMLSGSRAFGGETIFEVCDRIAHHQPPALGGDVSIIAYDRIIQKAIEKRPADRFPSAAAMSSALLDVRADADPAGMFPIRQTRRVIALPLRVLRPDPETDFLAVSLPDAIGASIAKLDSVVVRSTLASSSPITEIQDLKRLAREMDVDLVLTGTLLRAGDQIRVTAQLLEGVSGTIVWSNASQGSLGDLFALQDAMLHEITTSLATPLAGSTKSGRYEDVPSTPRAYELYLRANQLTLSNVYTSSLTQVRDMYQECVQEDPNFAPAWAKLGRVLRLIAKYGHGEPGQNYTQAARALSKALELNPDLSIAHNYYTYLQLEEGQALSSMIRLLERARRRPDDPGAFAGLVPALRFCGLLRPSLEAERRATRLDPGIRTSVHYTHWMLGEYEAAMAADIDEPPFLRAAAPAMLGRIDEALEIYREFERRGFQGSEAVHTQMVRAALEDDREACMEGYRAFLKSHFHDPEGIFLMGRNLARTGAVDAALDCLRRSVNGGFWCIESAVEDPWLGSLRGHPEFTELLRRCEDGRRSATEAYITAGAVPMLGPVA